MVRTSAWDFMQTIASLRDDVLAQMKDPSNDFMFLAEQKMALDTAEDLWDNLSKAGGWEPGQTLEDAYNRYEEAIKGNLDASGTNSGEAKAYADVLEYVAISR